MHKIAICIVSAALTPVSGALAQDYQEYEIPPSSSTTLSVPYISDVAMKECVRIYNEAKWLSEEIDGTEVNRYSQAAVNAYNAKVSQHANMTAAFNRDCAGKQSESAYRAAQELNKANQGTQADPE